MIFKILLIVGAVLAYEVHAYRKCYKCMSNAREGETVAEHGDNACQFERTPESKQEECKNDYQCVLARSAVEQYIVRGCRRSNFCEILKEQKIVHTCELCTTDLCNGKMVVPLE